MKWCIARLAASSAMERWPPPPSKLPVPRKEALRLKSKSQWRYIGKGHPSYDLAALCTGKAVYGMDARMDGMVYAAVMHPPVLGGKVKSYDDKEALKVKGVRQVVAIDPFKPPAAFQPLGGLAVIADNTWAAFQGRKKLAVVWDNGPNAVYNSAEYKKELLETARAPGKIARNAGNVDAEFEKSSRVIEAEYYIPHLAHAPMEPPVAVAEYRDGKVTAWTCTQNPQAVQDIVAEQLKIPLDNVICHVTLLGGGFGRKSKPDYVAEAAVLSKKVGRPVKVVWSREDDIKFGYYHTVSAMYVKAALDANGKPTAWLQRSVFPPIASTFKVGERYGDADDLSLGWTDIPYDIPNLRVENGPAKAYVRIGWLRSVANIYHAFAIQSFSDELAHAAGRDPVDYLLELIGPPRIVDLKGTDYPNYDAPYTAYPIDTGRLRRVIQIAAEKAGWGKRKMGNGTGMGIAVHRSFLTYVATVVEVEVDGHGKLKIPRVHTAVDAGSDHQSGNRPRPVRGRSGVRREPRAQRRNHRDQRRDRSVEFLRLPCGPHAGGSATHRRLPGRQRRSAGGYRRAGRSAVCAGVVQCDIRGDRQTGARTAALEASDHLNRLARATSAHDKSRSVCLRRRCSAEAVDRDHCRLAHPKRTLRVALAKVVQWDPRRRNISFGARRSPRRLTKPMTPIIETYREGLSTIVELLTAQRDFANARCTLI